MNGLKIFAKKRSCPGPVASGAYLFTIAVIRSQHS